MDLQTDIKWIQKELQEVKDPMLIEVFKNMLKYRRKMSSNRDTIEDYNVDIDLGIKEIENGEFHTQEEALKIASQW